MVIGYSKAGSLWRYFNGFCDSLRNYTSEAKLKNFKYTSEELTDILKEKEVLELVEKIIELTKEFDQEISYLLQAKQYIPNIPLLTKIQQAIDKLPDVLNNQEDAKIANYKAELKQVRSEYADWYLTQYLANRISELEGTQKSKVLNSKQTLS